MQNSQSMYDVLLDVLIDRNGYENQLDVKANDFNDFLLNIIDFDSVRLSIVDFLRNGLGMRGTTREVNEFLFILCNIYGAVKLGRAWDNLPNRVNFDDPRELKKLLNNNGILMTVIGYLGQEGYFTFEAFLSSIRNNRMN